MLAATAKSLLVQPDAELTVYGRLNVADTVTDNGKITVAGPVGYLSAGTVFTVEAKLGAVLRLDGGAVSAKQLNVNRGGQVVVESPGPQIAPYGIITADVTNGGIISFETQAANTVTKRGELK